MKAKPAPHPAIPSAGLDKAHGGIRGLDEVTGGGLPKGRTTLICGACRNGVVSAE